MTFRALKETAVTDRGPSPWAVARRTLSRPAFQLIPARFSAVQGFYTPAAVSATVEALVADLAGFQAPVRDRACGSFGLGMSALAELLRADRAAIAIQHELDARFPAGPSVSEQTLLATAEEDNGVPQITMSLAPVAGLHSRAWVAVEAMERITALQQEHAALQHRMQDLRRYLNVLGKLVHYEFLDTVPIHETSPCGIVRLATPIIPRAPRPGAQPLVPTAA
ncbi:hypothetical protein IPZ58_27625 [Streptomyces roseoverticillatus]|uniref:hypothetical protein n=1 Tax=Streptomyces roseoverticillatus TaxID=66429 RepID=UPI001F2A1069|nr:hypothetical protein [Streptomyces roseoverticillatus]MCF3105335.1 hypothetical protein [Streptomyces roseoverticillatus]